MSVQRKRYSAEMKAKIALEAIKGQKMANEIAAEYGVHPTQIAQWKKQALDGLPDVFSLGKSKQAQNVVQVNQQIGQPQPSTGTEEEILKIATSLFEHIESQIRFADTKAQLILAADAFLAGAIVKGDIKGLLPIMHINRYFVSLTNILTLLALAVSFFCALTAVIPRKLKNLREDIGPTAQNTRLIPLTWDQIVNVDTKLNKKPWDAFINSFANQTSTGLKNSILTETFIKARNAQKKYKYVRLSIYCLFAVLALWLITQLLLALSY